MTQKEIEEIINEFWNNEELQMAISDYGEWNNTELNKVKEKILKKTIYEKTRSKLADNLEPIRSGE